MESSMMGYMTSSMGWNIAGTMRGLKTFSMGLNTASLLIFNVKFRRC